MEELRAGSGSSDAAAALYEAIVKQAPDAVIFADAKGAIRIWNAAAEAMFGYADLEVLGQSLDLIIPERFRSTGALAFVRDCTQRYLAEREARKGAACRGDASAGKASE